MRTPLGTTLDLIVYPTPAGDTDVTLQRDNQLLTILFNFASNVFIQVRSTRR